MKQTENFKYEKAIDELEEITERMESGKMDIDSMASELKRAQTLIKQCKDKLTKTDEEIQKILNSDKSSFCRTYGSFSPARESI